MHRISTIRTMLTLFLACCGLVAAQEVRVHPAEVVYAYDNVGEGTPTGLSTAVVQHVAVVNTGDRELELEGLRIEARRGERDLATVEVGPEPLARAARQYRTVQEAGLLELYDFQLHTTQYLAGITLAGSTSLAPRSALVMDRIPLLFSETPDSLTIVATLETPSGEAVPSPRTTLRVERYDQQNDYHFPVHGRWFVAAAPSLHSHHRWAVLQEFALDLIQLGPDTKSHVGDGSELEQYFAYGEPVHAAADGVVVAADGSMSESSTNLQQPDESDEAYMQRTMAAQQELISKGFDRVLGNHVIVRHQAGEHSHYLHLQPGSVGVEVGDRVQRGQRIGAVGHSGNSTEPHLHFHVTAGPDRASSRSLPVEFSNLRLWPAGFTGIRHLHSGQIVVAEPSQTEIR